MYIFGSKVAICVGDQYESNYVPELQLGLYRVRARYVFVRLLTCV